jgi:alpha-galactosidase
MVVANDQSEALLTYIQVKACTNVRRCILLDGLDPHRYYRIEETGRSYPGDLLMQGGLLMEPMAGDCLSLLYHLMAEE